MLPFGREKMGWAYASNDSSLHRSTKVRLESAPLVELVSQLVVEVDDLAAPGLLGSVHRVVGVEQQTLRRCLGRRERRDADAGREVDVVSVGSPTIGFSRSSMIRFANRADVALVMSSVEGDDELVAAEPSDDIVGSQGATQSLAVSASTRSPPAWPNRSLTSLKWSRSMNMRLIGWSGSFARSARCCITPARFKSSVEGVVRCGPEVLLGNSIRAHS